VDRIQKHPQKHPRFGIPLLLATSVFTAAIAAVPVRSASAAVTPTVTTCRAAPVQLADEITRRLRRIGVSFSRTRLQHPYDPAGEIC